MVTAWVSNCGMSNNGRLTILEALTGLNVSVRNFGRCGVRGGSTAAQYHDTVWEESSENWKALRKGTLRVPLAPNMARENFYEGGVSLFYYAAENTNCEHYHTEKMLNGYNSGAVPIYLGSSLTAREWFPNNSAIYVADYPNITDLAKHLLYLAGNETAYNEYLAWRKLPIPPHAKEKIDFGAVTKTPKRFCDICEFLHKNYHNRTRVFKAVTRERCK